ncbi:uncharacterized protein LOC136037432 isoform X2 [Artemia franciscana]|uniref:Uncharacterized protein n=1 Tax=Artemia franciscana TaxID=6661 RepID=A0AA88HTX9_ARTSF|nr:hypothetical protein QYM36_010623 [Artemia franciscana]
MLTSYYGLVKRVYPANKLVIHKAESLEDICFASAYKSIISDLESAYQLLAIKDTEKYKHSTLLPDVHKAMTPDNMVKTVKARMDQLCGIVANRFKQKFIDKALSDRSFAHLKEDVLLDICIDDTFDEIELQLPLQVNWQVQRNFVRILSRLQYAQKIIIKVGRDFEDGYKKHSLNKNVCEFCGCFLCSSVDDCLNIISNFAYLRVIKFTGMGGIPTKDCQNLFQSFGETCHFLEVFHMNEVMISGGALLHLIHKEPSLILESFSSLWFTHVTRDVPEKLASRHCKRYLHPCFKSLSDLEVQSLVELEGPFVDRALLIAFFVSNLPKLKYINIGGKCLGIANDNFCSIQPLAYSLTPQSSFTLKRLVIQNRCDLSQIEISFLKRHFLHLEEVNVEFRNTFWNTQKSTGAHIMAETDKVDQIVPQVKILKISVNPYTQHQSGTCKYIDYFSNIFQNIEELVINFVPSDFKIIDKLDKLRILVIKISANNICSSIKSNQSNQRTSVQKGFMPLKSYCLTSFICPNVCLGPDVAREIVKNSPVLQTIELLCIHGIRLTELDSLKHIHDFEIGVFDYICSVDDYYTFVERWNRLTKVSFPSLLMGSETEAVPRLLKLYDFCYKKDIKLNFVVSFCNKFWDNERKMFQLYTPYTYTGSSEDSFEDDSSEDNNSVSDFTDSTSDGNLALHYLDQTGSYITFDQTGSESD